MTTEPRTCPIWADRLFREIHAMEVKLGNIREPNDAQFKGSEWSQHDLDALSARLEGSDDERYGDDETVDELFRKAAEKLTAEGFSAEEIAEFANQRIGAGGKMPYCDASEVREALA